MRVRVSVFAYMCMSACVYVCMRDCVILNFVSISYI